MNLKGKNVFISGPMTGLPFNNVPAFLEAHELLNELGAKEVYDPAYEYYSEVASGLPKGTHDYYMRRCIHELSSSGICKEKWNVMVQLRGWEESEGCLTEFDVAKACGIKVVGIEEIEDGEKG